MSTQTVTDSKQLLYTIATGWDKRARVKNQIKLDLDFELTKQDFLDELLPFKDHPFYLGAPCELKSKVLSAAWILYNAKTICIETDIVHPVCLSLLADTYKGISDFTSKQLISETLVDEAYHIHLCYYANEVTKRHRQLNFQLPTFAFVRLMQKEQSNFSDRWQQMLIQLLTAITSEIYITDYLALVTKEKTANLQPLNSLVVKTHRADELAHGKIFTHIAKEIFCHLDHEQQRFFAEMMHKPIQWLINAEYDVWLSVLEQIHFPNYQQMIQEANEARADDNDRLDKSIDDLVLLGQEIGVFNVNQGKEVFNLAN